MGGQTRGRAGSRRAAEIVADSATESTGPPELQRPT